MTAPASIAGFIGLPFAEHGRGGGYDCWGLAREVLRACAGISLPDYGHTYKSVEDHDAIVVAIHDGLAEGWERVEDGRLYDVVIFNIAGKPTHIGVMLGPTTFLHCPEPSDSGAGGTSRIESIDSRLWRNRVEGIYRYTK